MLIDSEDIKKTKEYMEIMQAFADGKEIEYKENFSSIWTKATTPKWNFGIVEYRIKLSEPEIEYTYPIYKKVKNFPETVVKFTSIDEGIYISTAKISVYKPGDKALNMCPHTHESWEDCDASVYADKSIIGDSDIIELFEVIKEIDGRFYTENKLYEFKEITYFNSPYIRTGRSFVINKRTKEVIKIKNKKKL